MVRSRPAGKPMSSMTRFQVPCGILRLHVGSDDFDTGLVGGVHRSRGEIIGIAIHDEAQRFSSVPLSEIELEPVKLGESDEGHGLEIRYVLAVALGDERQDVVTVIVPSTHRETRIATWRSHGIREMAER